MNGPYESANNILRILKTLTKICGAGGFDNLHKLDDGMDDEFMWFQFYYEPGSRQNLYPLINPFIIR